MYPIIVEKISLSYGSLIALKDISISVAKGELYGLIGPDGAGKTSLFRILATLILPDSGKASLVGLDVVDNYKEIRQIVGYMPGRFSLYGDLTVEENLELFARLFETTIEENYHLIEDIYRQLEPFKKRRAANLSGGMKQKLALCCALIHEPKVLLLDEPTTGVDPVSRVEFWEMLKRLKEKGIAILVSTPYMDEANLCDRISLIRDGEILMTDTPSNVAASLDFTLLAVASSDMYRLLKDIRKWEGCHSCFAFGDTHHLVLKEGFEERDIKKLLEEIGHKDIVVREMKPTVEDAFMELLQKRTTNEG